MARFAELVVRKATCGEGDHALSRIWVRWNTVWLLDALREPQITSRLLICDGKRSIYQDIPLHSVDQFLKLAPPGMYSPEIMRNDHQLMIQRLSFELAERQR